jgi:choline dehydrogenase-like flavoprotein
VYADDEGTSIDALRGYSHEDLDEWIRANLRPVSHVAASCSQAVLKNAALRLVEGVFIADASVLASVPSETPAGSVTIEARRIAREIERVLS